MKPSFMVVKTILVTYVHDNGTVNIALLICDNDSGAFCSTIPSLRQKNHKPRCSMRVCMVGSNFEQNRNFFLLFHRGSMSCKVTSFNTICSNKYYAMLEEKPKVTETKMYHQNFCEICWSHGEDVLGSCW